MLKVLYAVLEISNTHRTKISIQMYGYVHMKPLLSMFMKGNEVTLREQNQS